MMILRRTPAHLLSSVAGVAGLVVCVSCGTRAELWSSGPGPLDGSAAVERRCPSSRPRLDSDCKVGDPPFACDFEGELCAGGAGTRATRVFSCYAGRKGSFWFFGNARSCECPSELPVEGTACTGPTRTQGDCKYYADGCGSSCSCVAAKWECLGSCAGPNGGCPTVRPSRFLPCGQTGLSCTYPDATCPTTSACVPREGMPAGTPGVWVTVSSPETCTGE